MNLSKGRRGYIRIYRDILDDQIWGISKYLRGWIFLQIKATHSDSNMDDIKLKRGDFFIGFKKMMASLNFKTQDEVVQFLDYLVQSQKITYAITEKGIHGHLTNYETDQPSFNNSNFNNNRKFNDDEEEVQSSFKRNQIQSMMVEPFPEMEE